MSVDPAGLEVLSESRCFALLATMPVGRVLYSDQALPVIVPVNFKLDGTDVVVRTARRSRLASKAAGQVVAFEADQIDVATRSGWSVVLTGRFELVEDAAEVAHLESLGLESWVPAPTDRYLRMRPDIVSGRLIPKAMIGSTDAAETACGAPVAAEVAGY